MLSDKKVPYSLKCIIRELNDKKKRGEAIKDYRDYMFGKAKQTQEVEQKTTLEITKKQLEEVDKLFRMNMEEESKD